MSMLKKNMILSDLAGVDMSINQDTPIALQKRESAVIFGEDVYIQDPLESFPPGRSNDFTDSDFSVSFCMFHLVALLLEGKNSIHQNDRL